MLQFFMDEKSADVAFEVGGQKVPTYGSQEGQAVSSTTFYAHRFILQQCASPLADLCK
ncbi:hypothetical protein ACHAXR_000494, partial [Thalassiosira sp. AJA248-18]